MSLIRINQLNQEIMQLVDNKIAVANDNISRSLLYAVQDTPPQNVTIGFRWFDTSTGLMKIWNGSGLGVDWEILNQNAITIPSRNIVDSLTTVRKYQTTGSGFINFGGHISGTAKTVNKAMMANDSIPQGEWFKNFFLMNGNGYVEDGMGTSTGEFTEVIINGFNVTIAGSMPNIASVTNGLLTAINLPDAPNTPKELTRNEIVFIEAWTENIETTGYVFPYGNVQYGKDDCDGIMTRLYSGPAGYCASFKDDAIKDANSGILVAKGKGWLWSELKTVQRNLIAANCRHNIYVDNGKLVQLRYRLRVETYSNETPVALTNTTYLGFTSPTDATSMLKAQGAKNEPKTEQLYSFLSAFNDKNPIKINGTYATQIVEDIAYDGKVYAIPVVIVARRNKGVFDKTFNPNGTSRFREGIRLVADYDASDDIIGFALMDRSNATLASSTTGNTWEDKYNKMMTWLFDRTTILTEMDNAVGFTQGGDMASGISGRYDGLYYDEVNERDIKDLRKNVTKSYDLKYVLEHEFNKFVSNDIRGWEGEMHTYYWRGNIGKDLLAVDASGQAIVDSNGVQVTGYTYTSTFPITSEIVNNVVYKNLLESKVTGDLSTVLYIRASNQRNFVRRRKVKLVEERDASGAIINDSDGNPIRHITLLDGAVFVDADTEIMLASPKFGANRRTKLSCDIIGDPKGNSAKYVDGAEMSPTDILEAGNTVVKGPNVFMYRGTKLTYSTMPAQTDGTKVVKINELDPNLWTDVTGKGGYYAGWQRYGHIGTPLVVMEDESTMLPRDIINGYTVNGDVMYLNSKFFKMSDKVKKIKKVMVNGIFFSRITAPEDGKSVLEVVNSTPGTYEFGYSDISVKANTLAINWQNLSDDAIIEVFYEADSACTVMAASSTVEQITDVWAGNSLYPSLGANAVSQLINKVPVYDAPIASTGSVKRVPLETYLYSKGTNGNKFNEDWTVLTHKALALEGNGPAIKILPYLTYDRGVMFLELLYKELDPTLSSGKSYTLDNGRFKVIDGTGLDDNDKSNGYRVKVGQKRIELPYFFGDVK